MVSVPDDLGFIKTITDDDVIEFNDDTSESDEDQVTPLSKEKRKKKRTNEFNNNFQFDISFKDDAIFDMDFALRHAKRKKLEVTSLDEKIIQIRRQKKKATNTKEKSENITDDWNEDDDDSFDEEETNMTDVIRDKGRKKKSKKKIEDENKVKFEEDIDFYDKDITFQEMNLSRPVMKALASMKFDKPMPIQAATIPVALLGRDICACAVTGSGKTAAFMLPIIERLLYKPKNSTCTRVLVLLPTRELAVQVHQVARQLAQFTNIDMCIAAGGLDLKMQEAALRKGPDVVIATPGRLIDHLHNAPHFSLHTVEILVLDEADRMLDDFFAEQMKEIIRLCSRQRQTMLFSATMTDEVQDLAKVSLDKPIKVFINENTDVAFGLRQEFIRIRPTREGDREAIVTALVSRIFCNHCIIFVQTKKQAHRMHIIFGLCGINVGELHGNLSQAQRLEALKRFKEARIDVLLATDLAARGLDIEGVKTVINLTMPSTIKHYVHRVGRTARAGKKGRAVSLVGEKERSLLKEIVKKAHDPVKARVVPQEVINKYRDRIEQLEDDIKAVEKIEKEEKEIQLSEMQLSQINNKLEGTDEQNRKWFQSKKEKIKEKLNGRLSKMSEEPVSKKSKQLQGVRKSKNQTPVSTENRIEFEVHKAQLCAARFSKKFSKAKRIKACPDTSKKGIPVHYIYGLAELFEYPRKCLGVISYGS
ncbi:probable ATP-dependent RNA helicase DDX27 [Octopus bimaculoides]|uniref:probable ATP-dependent RNA helicase DDX27 n=1 Tax=Octopus bimaculoides TaxID=37653 RepID=UPI00071CA51D|nr:probable ATP-dependent RNA helicase DDX27 [Octopus bimaculoides]|eukprot:XP_014769102.1 PREDICTED: probable ATP-dependent RNA helicase DDX27 [Octopus bimaculoides]